VHTAESWTGLLSRATLSDELLDSGRSRDGISERSNAAGLLAGSVACVEKMPVLSMHCHALSLYARVSVCVSVSVQPPGPSYIVPESKKR